MVQSKLIQSLSTLSAWELRHFYDFVHSPFFNKNEKVRDLVDIIVDASPDFEHESLKKESVFEKVFGIKKFNEQQFKDLMSLTLKTFRSFLGFYRLRQDEFMVNRAYLQASREKLLDKEFLRTFKLMENNLETDTDRLQEIRLRELRLQEEWITYLNAKQNRAIDDSVQKASDLLDNYYLLYKLKYGVEMANRQNVVAQEFDTGFLEVVVKYLEFRKKALEKSPEIKIYYLIYRSLTEENAQEEFFELEKMLGNHAVRFPKPDQREMFGYAINYCIRQINKGLPDFLNNLLTLYQKALETGVLFEDGWLSQWDYKNIVTAGLKARKFDWTQSILDNYKDKIEPDSRENAYTFNLASLYYEKAEYGKALKLLQHVEFSDVFYSLSARVLLLKSYYEMGDHDALTSLCESFKIYLKRNTTLSKDHYTINFNLISLVKKLSDLRSKQETFTRAQKQRKLDLIRNQMAEKRAVAQSGWLKEKISELEKVA